MHRAFSECIPQERANTLSITNGTASGIARIVLPTRECCIARTCVCVCVRIAWPCAIVEIGSPLVRDLQFRRVDRHDSAVRQLGTWNARCEKGLNRRPTDAALIELFIFEIYKHEHKSWEHINVRIALNRVIYNISEFTQDRTSKTYEKKQYSST